MTKTLRTVLASIGSVLDIAPRADYGCFVPRETPEERMRGHWQRSGDSIRRAMQRCDDGQAPQAARARR